MREGAAHRVRAGGCVMACWNAVIPYLCPEMPEAQKAGIERIGEGRIDLHERTSPQLEGGQGCRHDDLLLPGSIVLFHRGIHGLSREHRCLSLHRIA